MTKEEEQVINETLPKGFDWAKVQLNRLGNFSQLIYRDKLVGYVMQENGKRPYFKGVIWKK